MELKTLLRRHFFKVSLGALLAAWGLAPRGRRAEPAAAPLVKRAPQAVARSKRV